MDVISLGKAKKSLREMKEYHQNILGENVETHFPSIDARLDYLEKQLAYGNIQTTINLISSAAKLSNAEIVNGKVQLLDKGKNESGIQLYSEYGYYEIVVDVGPAAMNFLGNIITITKSAKHTVTVTIAESDDKLNFDLPQTFTTTYKPTKRYIKIRVDILSTDTFESKVQYSLELEPNENIVDNNSLRTSKEYEMTKDETWSNEGSLHRAKLNQSEQIRIDKINMVISF